MRRKVNISWYSVNFDEADESTSLFFIELFFDTLKDITPPFVLFHGSLSAENESIFAKALLFDISHDICLVSAQDILDVQRKNVARHAVESHIDVDVNEIVAVAHIDNKFGVGACIHITLYLKDSEPNKYKCANYRHKRSTACWFRQISWHLPENVEFL